MTDTGIFCSGAHVVQKAGANVNSTIAASGAFTNEIISQVESYINTVCKYNFSDTYNSLNADVKGILKEVASDLGAVYMINYDMSGYTSRQEATTMLDVLMDRANDGLKLLKEKQYTDFISGA